jgi:hypothetical protein
MADSCPENLGFTGIQIARVHEVLKNSVACDLLLHV